MGLKYVLMLMGSDLYLVRTVATEDVSGTLDEAVAGLRHWLLTQLSNSSHDNGWYTGRLVRTDDDGSYDTYFSLAVEDAIWYWDQECVPVST